MLPEILLQIGIPLIYLFAGIGGGVVNAYLFNRTTIRTISGAIVVGGLSGAYLTDLMVALVNLTAFKGAPAAFVVGFSGGALCKLVAAGVAKAVPGAFKQGDSQ